jgi:hypothetical protein
MLQNACRERERERARKREREDQVRWNVDRHCGWVQAMFWAEPWTTSPHSNLTIYIAESIYAACPYTTKLAWPYVWQTPDVKWKKKKKKKLFAATAASLQEPYIRVWWRQRFFICLSTYARHKELTTQRTRFQHKIPFYSYNKKHFVKVYRYFYISI